VDKRLAGPDETCPAITLAGNAPSAVQQIATIDLICEIDLISDTAEDGVRALSSLASLRGSSRFDFGETTRSARSTARQNQSERIRQAEIPIEPTAERSTP
jgi:hypothetical protein